MDNDVRYVAAANFKANCLRLMDEVARHRKPIIITKRGKPVAKLVPIEETPVDRWTGGPVRLYGGNG
jgi:prevent-host-death family protein